MKDTLIRACVPMPLQVVIDDVGWWSGQDGHERGEPYRTGIERDHVVADYEAIARLGRKLVIRPQMAMILCEWDRENVLRTTPTCTWMGSDWDNKRWVGPWLREAADLIRENSRQMELTIHGVGHEYWADGVPTRAEWYDDQGNMRPRQHVEAHLDAYAVILRQHELDPLPTSFVPAAFRYAFGDGEQGLTSILARRGVTFVSTPFSSLHKRSEPQTPWFGVEHGVMVADRGREPRIPWYEMDSEPQVGEGPIVGLHWPNILHPDPDRNFEVVDRWVEMLSGQNRRFDATLSRDTASCLSQLAYHAGTRVLVEGRDILLDFAELRRLPRIAGLGHAFTLKTESSAAVRFGSSNARVRFMSRDVELGICTLRVEVSSVQHDARIRAG